MTAPLNLSQKRGPSVWEQHDRTPSWELIAFASGAVLAGSAWWLRSRRAWLIPAAATAVTVGLVGRAAGRVIVAMNQRCARRPDHDEMLDQALDESFPASDPPAMTYGV
jgi:hypothetical protein